MGLPREDRTPATEAQLARLRPLVDRLLTPGVTPFGVPCLPTIRADDPAFVALGARPHPQILGLDPSTAPLAAVIGVTPPAMTIGKFGSLAGAIEAGRTLEHGAALLYGLQTAGIVYRDPDVLETLARSARTMKILFQYDQRIAEVVGTERLDAVLMELTASWDAARDLPVWYLLEFHASWSSELSDRVIAAVASAGSVVRHAVWDWRGNTYATAMHRSRLAGALAALKPYTATQANAKRWATKLRGRVKAEGSGP